MEKSQWNKSSVFPQNYPCQNLAIDDIDPQRKTLDKIINFFLDTVFPKYCVTCDTEGEYLCQSCFGKTVAPYSLLNEDIIAAGSYQNYYLKEAIHYLKYRLVSELAVPLSKLIVKTLEQKFTPDYFKDKDLIIVPVPLHRKKLKQRGFNQVEIIAGLVGRHFNLKTESALQKIRATKPQMSIEARDERLKNLEDVFVCADKKLVTGKKIFLIDDVATTGTTLSKCARVLKQAGAKKVWKVVVARG